MQDVRHALLHQGAEAQGSAIVGAKGYHGIDESDHIDTADHHDSGLSVVGGDDPRCLDLSFSCS